MSAAAYADLNDGTHVMDGYRARRHLVTGLGMQARTLADAGSVAHDFAEWIRQHGSAVTVRGGAPTFLVPPPWYARST